MKNIYSIVFVIIFAWMTSCKNRTEHVTTNADRIARDCNNINYVDSIKLRTYISILDLSKNVGELLDNNTEIYEFLFNNYVKDIHARQLTEMFGEPKYERTDTLFYGKPHDKNWYADLFYEYSHYFYLNFNVEEKYKDVPKKTLYLKDWYIGNDQLLRGYFDTDNGFDTPVFSSIYSFNPELYKPYYVTEFKDKSPKQVSETICNTPFKSYELVVRNNAIMGVYWSWINPRYASDGDTLKYIVWMLDDSSYLELFYKETKPDSLIMVGGDWFTTSDYLEIDW